MSEIMLSEYQKNIINGFKTTKGNMLINALAGTGKTYILTELSKLVSTYSVFVAFNKSIQEELKTRITNPKFKVYTLNGLGFLIMNHNWEKMEEERLNFSNEKNDKKRNIQLNQYKTLEMIPKIIEPYQHQFVIYGDKDEDDIINEYYENIGQLFDLCRQRMVNINNRDDVIDTIDFYELFANLDIPESICEILNDLMLLDMKMFKEDGVIDFIDQVFLTYILVRSGEWQLEYYHKFENIFADECQDLSKIQQLFLGILRRSKTSRMIFVGDQHQCQPQGTKVLMIDGTEKNIEDIQIGDKVVQYSRRDGYFIGYNAKQIKTQDNCIVSDKKEFNVDKLVKVQLDNGYNSSYTYNHITFVKMNKKNTKHAVCLYLMYREQDQLFRIGKVKLYSKNSNTFCLRSRVLNEGFDKAWILNIYDTNIEAWINEQLYSLKYQIPQIIFQHDKVNYTADDIKNIYDNIGGNMFERAMKLLKEFNKDFNLPFFERGNHLNHISKEHGFFMYACNVFPKYMDMGYFDENNIQKRGQNDNDCGKNKRRIIAYSNIKHREFKNGEFKVYGITVPHTNMYVADKIVTHNSIYSFAGSDCHAVDNIRRLYNPIEYDLPINYRCPAKHLRYVNREFDIPIQPRPDAPEGGLYYINYKDIYKKIKQGDCILARKNSDLCRVALELLEEGFSIYIRDESLVNKLLKEIKKAKRELADLTELPQYINNIRAEQLDLLRERNQRLQKDGVLDNSSIEEITFTDTNIDLLDCVEILYEKYYDENKERPNKLKDFGTFSLYIQDKLQTKGTRNSIQCVSIHQSKGKEYDRVFILNNARVYTEFGRNADQRKQESNLSYIALTRSKSVIYLVDSPLTDNNDDEF